jgi:DNA-binding LacI/PurR family transcriptional regulator
VRLGAALGDHLVELGHRSVAVIKVLASESISMALRTAAMLGRQRGVSVVEILGAGLDTAGRWVTQNLRNPEIAAVMTPSDRHAVALLEQLQLRNVAVPGDLSVTGYDGIGELATPVIGLTH